MRNPFGIKFDKFNQLWVSNHGMDARGSRPIKNSPDEFRRISFNEWYGWPDYTGGYPITNPFFKPNNNHQPQFLLKEHPMLPKMPFVNFIPQSAIMGFDFNYNHKFGFYGDAFIAEFGPENSETKASIEFPYIGHRVTRIDMNTGQLFVFAQNKYFLPVSETNGSGLERPIDVIFGPDNSLYILDFGIFNNCQPIKNSGVIWKITKT